MTNDLENQKKDLRKNCEACVKKALEVLKPELKTKYYGDLELLSFLSFKQTALTSLSEFKICKEFMQQDPIISKHIDKMIYLASAGSKTSFHQYIFHILKKMIPDFIKSGNFNQALFDKYYIDLENFFFNEEIPVIVFAPIHNFNSKSLPIDFGDGLQIRAITEDEKINIRTNNYYGQIHIFEYSSLEYVIEIKKQIPKFFENEKRENHYSPLFETISKIIIALRLFKKGDFGYLITETKLGLDIPLYGQATHFNPTAKWWENNSYNLTDNEISNLQTFWNEFKNSNYKNTTPVDIAIKRFNFGHSRTSLVDQLIDYMISFEALFFKKGERGEQTHKIASRTSRLIESDFSSRKSLFNDMKDFYNKRSLIVHGDQESIAPKDVESIEEILRLSIKKFLCKINNESHNEIIDHLDLD